MKDLMTRVKKDVRRVLHNNRGFTLIELLIVLAIIAILAGIAVPRYTASLDKAKESACAANIAVLESAVMRYWADHLDSDEPYPENLAALKDKYIKDEPKCPKDNTTKYVYTTTTEGETGDVTFTITCPNHPVTNGEGG